MTSGTWDQRRQCRISGFKNDDHGEQRRQRRQLDRTREGDWLARWWRSGRHSAMSEREINWAVRLGTYIRLVPLYHARPGPVHNERITIDWGDG